MIKWGLNVSDRPEGNEKKEEIPKVRSAFQDSLCLKAADIQWGEEVLTPREYSEQTVIRKQPTVQTHTYTHTQSM